MPSETGEASETGPVFRLVGCAAAVGVGSGLAPGDGLMVGNRLAALPAPMNTLASPFSAGMGPSGSTTRCSPALGEAEPELDAAAAATVVVSAAAGGVHFVVVTTLAVAVSFTELTEAAFDATAICAFRLVAFVVTELRLHEAVPSSLAHPLLNVGFWLDGCAVSATDTSEAVPFLVDTCTT